MLKITLAACILSISSLANATLINLATDGTASQSSTQWGGVADRAIDGNTNGIWPDGSVSHTNRELDNQWWQVDLGQLSLIDEIVLWNRSDCCGDRLNNFEIFLDGVSLFTHADTALLAPDPSFSFSVNGLEGQTIRIQKFADTGGKSVNNDGFGATVLSLAEVQVFGTEIPRFISSATNVPEPSALGAFALGLIGLGIRKLKKKS